MELQIEKVTVRNYRCIGKLEIDKLAPITILVGRNNTGKSALLEALALASAASEGWRDCLGDDLIEPMIERRGGWQYSDMMIKIGENRAEIDIAGDHIGGKLEIAKDIEVFPDDIRQKLASGLNEYIMNLFDSTVRTAERYMEEIHPRTREERMRLPLPSPRLEMMTRNLEKVRSRIWEYPNFIVYSDERRGKLEYAILLGERFRTDMMDAIARYIHAPYPLPKRVVSSSDSGRSRTIFLLRPSVQYLKELQRRLAQSGDLIRLVGTLREKISYFVDIREVDESFLVFVRGLERPVPLESMGDGFRAKLAILSAIAAVKKGIALMEEPETRLHPGYVSSLVDEIGKTASDGKLQYVVSTHSLDFLDAVLETVPELVKVVRMYRMEDTTEIDFEILDGKESLEERDKLKMDLRGV